MTNLRSLGALFAFVALVAAQHATDVAVPANLPTRKLGKDVYGYSIEPAEILPLFQTDLASNLLLSISDTIGTPPPIRIGGTTADETYFVRNLNESLIKLQPAPNVTIFNISQSYYSQWSNYFPQGTKLIYTLNFVDNSSAWANAVAEAGAAWQAAGDKLKKFELGNEVDHYISKGWRNASWDVAEYVGQWRNLSSQIVATEWYRAAADPPKFQAGVIADPPWVPDQQDEVDDLDIINITRAGLTDRSLIDTYAMHLYPQSTCDTERWLRLRLDLLSNHTALWLNVSQYVPQVAAADSAGIPLVLGETNSVSCGGRSGISDTFGAALWGVDYVLLAASIGIPELYMHIGGTSEYSSFVPTSFTSKNESLSAGIRAGFYGHYFIANVVRGTSDDDDDLSVAALPGANSSDLSGYAVYGGNQTLKKLVFLDMGIYNGSEGLSNPSTLSSTDNTDPTYHTKGPRPQYNMTVSTPWVAGQSVNVTRLSGPGTNAKSQVNVSGISFDPATGKKLGTPAVETLRVGPAGSVQFKLQQAEAVLLELVGSGASSNGSSGAGSTSGVVTVSAAENVAFSWWNSMLAMLAVCLCTL
ncbi:DNA methylase N-6 adenine-specific conserved site [Pleurostoma richardsiae]|uniref:DNA methylase N-6 adenine-specific conserved site n=1 Tax=Pleurostoma richardsiae TaxID=41990 RepID=A0AA38VD67_9PEZI|nr:DNA methylase N-6 adenine-specific conserved site [Pleurostoma richardsiae]